MERAVRAKCPADPQLVQLSMATGDHSLLSIKPDAVWGFDAEHGGLNLLARIWERLRAEFAAAPTLDSMEVAWDKALSPPSWPVMASELEFASGLEFVGVERNDDGCEEEEEWDGGEGSDEEVFSSIWGRQQSESFGSEGCGDMLPESPSMFQSDEIPAFWAGTGCPW